MASDEQRTRWAPAAGLPAAGPKEGDHERVVDPHLVFRVGQIWFAVQAEMIDEICEVAAPTPLPLAPVHIPGVINLRGQAVPLVDLKIMLDVEGAPPAGDAAPPASEDDGLFSRIAVASADGMRVGLLCDQVRGVVEVPRDDRRRPEVALGARLLEFVAEEVNQESGLILLLDLVKLLNAAKVQR